MANVSTGQEAGRAFEKAGSIQLTNLNEPDDFANTMCVFKLAESEYSKSAANEASP
jgi:hypothetical protein